MITPQLLEYVRQQIQQGVPKETLKSSLLAHNWPVSDVEEVLAMTGTSTPPIPAPPVFAAPSTVSSTVAPVSAGAPTQSSPKGVIVIAVLYFLGSLVFIPLGILAFAGAGASLGILDGFLGPLLTAFGTVFIFFGVLGIVVGVGLWKHKNWARLTVIILSLLSMLFALIAMAGGSVFKNVFLLAAAAIIAGYLYFNSSARSVFGAGSAPDQRAFWVTLALLFVITVASATYGLTQSQETALVQQDSVYTQTETPTTTTSTALQSEEEVKKVYLQMRAELDAVKSYADVEALVVKYGSATQLARVEAGRQEVQNLPPSFKDQLVSSIKIPPSTEIRNVRVTIKSTTATLEAESTTPGLIGAAVYVLENGQWKMDSDNWSQVNRQTL